MKAKAVFRAILAFCFLHFSGAAQASLCGKSAPSHELLPTGFEETLLASGLSNATSLNFAPDGRLFVSTQDGKVRIIKDGTLIDKPFISLDVDSQGEHGLIGVAFDPEFSTNHFVYIYYVAKSPSIHSRVSRFVACGDMADTSSEKILLDLEDVGTSIFHVGGSLHFGIDKKLYIAVGDNAGLPQTNNAQNLSTHFGKILRINTDGTSPTDNPFYNTTGAKPEIWAYGLRNPFSFVFQKDSSRMFINDVGADKWEEINDAVAGDNFGWPDSEGATANPKFKGPLYTYAHGPATSTNKGCAITGGAFYPNDGTFPSEYRNKYYFIDYCSNWMRTIDLKDNSVADFATQIASNPVSLTLGPDGAFYYLSRWTGGIYRLSYTGVLSPHISTQPCDALASEGQSASFTTAATGESPLSYQWFRNKSEIPGATSATLNLTGVKLSENGDKFYCVVKNAYGKAQTNEVTLTVTKNQPPVGTITSPMDSIRYKGGDTIYFSGVGTDPEDGYLPPKAFHWSVVFHHNEHTHPFIPAIDGVYAGSFTIPKTGETSANVWYRLSLTVTDSQGLTTTVYKDILPKVSTISLQTSPPGLQVTLDSQPVTTPAAISTVAGVQRTLGVVSPQTVNGVTYEFTSWSSLAMATNTIVTPSSPVTYTANFRPVGDKRFASFTASPNPIQLCDGTTAGIATLDWNATGVTDVEVHIGSPTGNLFAKGAPCSYMTTGKWVGDNTVFYLQDVSNGLPLSSENTLATVTVNVNANGCCNHRDRYGNRCD